MTLCCCVLSAKEERNANFTIEKKGNKAVLRHGLVLRIKMRTKGAEKRAEKREQKADSHKRSD